MARVSLFLRRLGRCDQGVALIEFALALPLLLLLVGGGLELTNLMLAHVRVNQIAITVADNAGRVRTGIDESNIYEVFAGADLVGRELDFSQNGRLVLSSLEPNGLAGTDAGQMINWQRCMGSLAIAPSYGTQGTGRTNAALPDGMGPVGSRITADDGTAVMFVEVTYRYKPVIFSILGDRVADIRYETAFNVRERTNQSITNTQNLAVKSC